MVVVAAGAVVDVDVPPTTEVEVVEVVEVAGNGGRLVAGVVSAPRQDAAIIAKNNTSSTIRLISGEVIDGLAVLNLLPSSRRRWAVGGGRWARTGTR